MARAPWYIVPCLGYCMYHCTHQEITVQAGEVGTFVDESNNYLFAEPGMHNIFSLYTKSTGRPQKVDTEGGDSYTPLPPSSEEALQRSPYCSDL